MKLPLFPLAMFTSSLLCLSTCCPVCASDSGHRPSSIAVDAGSAEAVPSAVSDTVLIPGPLRSFLRMAGVSQEATPDEVLPLLSRNVFLRGYQEGAETEYLILLSRYVQYARELQLLTAADGVIHVANCDDATKLIHILGYQFQQTCGQKNAYLLTADAERAFLTLDSGFPITGLEEALQKHIPFTYSFPATQVPVLFQEKDWTSISSWRGKGGTGLIDILLHDKNVDELYWALSRNDEETAMALRRSPGLKALLPLAPALDFYGSQICVRSGRVLVPGGQSAEGGWEELAGASPGSPAHFVTRLLAKDNGWLAAYFDALSRVSREQQARLTEQPRLKRLYDVYRRAGSGSSATRGIFPKNADLLILFTRLQWQQDEPYVPGTLSIWNGILTGNTSPELVRGWVKHATSWDSPDQLLLSLVACSSFETDIGPLQTYLMLSEVDRARAPGARLSDDTVRRLADNFPRFHDWYLIFSEFPALSDTSILQFMNSAETVNGIANPGLRSNAMGAFQANVGLWEILARQQQIPKDRINQSWQDMVQPFAVISSSIQLFDATRGSLRSLLVTVNGDANMSEDDIVDLLAGPPQESETGRQVHEILAERMRTVLYDQRLASLDTLFGLYDGLDEMAHGSAIGGQLVQLAGNLREFEMPRPIFTSSEKIEWAPGIYTSRHTELQVRTDLTKVIQTPGSAPQLEAARGRLTPFLRDTLVGLNYAYYEPPGAQALHHNPLFVRSQDFSGASIQGYDAIWASPELIGIGVTAGGGAYLIGSLAELPYALALTEEDFIAPANVQALIWKAEVPELLVSAVQPRWWGVSSTEMHAAGLYQRFGEELLVSSAKNPDLRGKVIEILSDTMTVRRLEMTGRALQNTDDANALISQVTPAEKFYLAVQFRKKFPAEAVSWGAAGRELDDLARKDPSDTDPKRLSRDFGVPHPTLAHTSACDILDVKPFPAFSGDPYRLLGESWESSNLYWARIADRMGYPPVMLNLLVPELTRHMIANIFATDLDDWPAVLRAMEQTGKEFQDGQITIATAAMAGHHQE
jgi:hypothetical protein